MTTQHQARLHDLVIEATIEQLQTAMASGEVTAKQLVEFYFSRISELDQAGTRLNTVLELNPDALHIADALDVERRQHGIRGPLHGIPVLLKDNIDTADKMHTSAGSLALQDHYATNDAFIVKRLRAAGAVILGKANMTEWANFISDHMPNGYSSRGGQVLNPYGPGVFDVGGSSAGSGAAVAANLTTIAVGTETSGSILSPSNRNSIVGIKPTVGLVSRSGIIPIAFSQDTAGPMARTVTDAAILLSVLTGVDEADPATSTQSGFAVRDYTVFLRHDGLKGARIGVPRLGFYDELSQEEIALMDTAISRLAAEGATIVDATEIFTKVPDWDETVLIYEFKSALNAYLRSVGGQHGIHSLADVISFNREHEETLRYGQVLFERAEATSGRLVEPAYVNHRLDDLRLSQTEGIDRVLQEYKLDAVVFPSYFGCEVAAKAGYPSVIVPAGYTADGQPFGLTFTGTAYSEPTLLKLAFAFEQATHHRVPPAL